MSTPDIFSAIFYKGETIFATSCTSFCSLSPIAVIMGSTLKVKKMLPSEAILFPLNVNPIDNGDKYI